MQLTTPSRQSPAPNPQPPKHGLISADDHVHEHPEVWTARLSKARWGDHIPHLERGPDGADRWVVNGQVLPLSGTEVASAPLADRTQEPQRWDDLPAAVHDPKARLKAMDADGVDYSVLYPSVAGAGGETFGRLTDPELELACVQAYNDWLIDEWVSSSERFVPQCIVPLAPDAAIAEIKRAVGRGHRGVVFPANPMELRAVPHLNGPEYDPVWETCEQLCVPICFHAGSAATVQAPTDPNFAPAIAAAYGAITRSASTVAVVVNLLISRILLRHPNLRVVFAESSLGWGPYLLEYTDHQFREDGLDKDPAYGLKPSEMFKRQCYLTGWYDRAAIRTRDIIGVENIMWSSNFPLASSTWPKSREFVARSFQGVPEAERNQILWGNAAKLYKLL